jgi:hypothetical protein
MAGSRRSRNRLGHCVHGIARELRRLARLILVEVGQDRPDEVTFGVLTYLLRDRDDIHACAFQPPPIMLEQIAIAEQPRETVHTDFGDATAGAQCMLEQRLQSGAIVGRPAEAASL